MGRWWYNTAFASARSYVAFVRPTMLTRDRLALLLPRDTLSAPRAIALMLLADQPAAAFTREPLALRIRWRTVGGSLIA